jgi:uncharacterized protein (TIGR02118 family)
VIKLVFCLRRRADLNREAFQRYWRETHAPLVAERAEVLQIRRYVQVHSLAAEAQVATRASRDAPEEFDGVAELWWDSWDALAANAGNPEAQRASAELLEDERRFIDLARSPLWWAEEHEIVAR